MEVITIESKAYQDILLKIDMLYGHIKVIADIKEKAEAESKSVWMDSPEVCKKLNISVRTLFRMKKEGRIKYSIFRGHSRYHINDVEAVLASRQRKQAGESPENTIPVSHYPSPMPPHDSLSDGAIKQIGRKIIVDADLALELAGKPARP